MTAKELKNALLQEAVQGKLVPQIASEGNARDLLEEIRKEKAKLVKEGKLKKEKPLPELTEEEIPFDIPDNWCWCRLGDITSLITDGKHGGGILENNSGFFFLSAKDIQNGKLIYTNADQITKDDFITTHKRTNLEPGDICIVNTGGTIGKLAIAPDDEKTNRTTFQKSVAIVKPFKNFVSNLYISNYFQFDLNNLVKISGGSAIHNLLLSDMKNELLPLPPLAEQKRIVAAIEKIMPLIEEYGKKETELKAFNEQIGTLTKKAILQEAVQGKLVPQIAAEGNAKDLLEEI
ncbi:restriction endonuclease subunit S, partial [Treponema sp.]|uniref:restriction endonuclease subunit S n=1 Tax=Treponema sp. TaxID=166 RepID=UPI0025F261B1